MYVCIVYSIVYRFDLEFNSRFPNMSMFESIYKYAYQRIWREAGGTLDLNARFALGSLY